MPNANASTVDPMATLPAGFVLDTGPNVFDQFDKYSGSDPMATLPAGAVLDGTRPLSTPADPLASLPPGFEIDTGANPATSAPASGGNAKPPTTFTQRMQKVWDNPTPGGLVSIVKGIYNGLAGGTELTKHVMQTGDMDDATLAPAAAQIAMDTMPLTGGGAIPPVTAAAKSSAVDAAVAAAERLGVTVPKYMATESSVAPRLAQGAKAVPWAGEPIVNAANQTRAGLQNAIDMAAQATTPDIAGGAAKNALIQNVKVDAPDAVSTAYNQAESLLTNPGARVPLTNTTTKMQAIMNARQNANLPEWSPEMNLIASAVTDPNGMNYAGIKLLRGALGERTPQQLIAEGIDPKVARQLYGPLTDDLQSSVLAGGGQPALDAWTEANTLAAQSAAQRKQLYKIVGVNGDVAPEQVFARLTQLAGTRGTANIALLQQAKNAMGPQAWGQVGNAIISRLGRDAQGAFSPDRFTGPTGYPSLSPQAKDTLFTPSQRSALDDLSAVSNQFSAKLSKFNNTSNTAHTIEAAGLLTAGWHAPISTIMGLAGTRGVAIALARPAVSRAAANLGRVQLMGRDAATIMARRAALATAIRAQLPSLSLNASTTTAPAAVNP